MCFIIFGAACRHRLASPIRTVNLHWRRRERSDGEIQGGCVLNSSWFSMILKKLSRNSKVALKAHWTLCVIAFCIYIMFVFCLFGALRLCVCSVGCSFYAIASVCVYLIRCACDGAIACHFPLAVTQMYAVIDFSYFRFMWGGSLRSAPPKRTDVMGGRGRTN